MQRVTFTNARGDTVELYRSPFFLSKIEGLGDVDTDIYAQKSPGQDGSDYISNTLSERYIPIEVDIVKDFNINRQTLSKVFNPKLGMGLLVYENDNIRREILAIPEHIPKFDDQRPRVTQKAIIDLVCHNPFWLDTDVTGHTLSFSVPQFGFPIQFTDDFKMETDGTNRKTVINNGDVDTPIAIEFNGPATNPIVVNQTTGEFIKVNQTLLSGEKLIINTALGKKRVEIDGRNVFNWVDIGSTFFQLQPGENEIVYLSDTGIDTASVLVQYRNRFLGV